MDKFARPQPFVLVWKLRLQLDRARGLIDLIVDQQELTFGELFPIVLIERQDRHIATQHRFAHRSKIALRQGEHGRAWLDLRKHGERTDVGGVDDVADVELAEADHAVDRRRDGCIIELRLRRLDRRLVGIDAGLGDIDLGLLRVDVLLRFVALDRQGLKARQVFLHVDELRLILALFRYRLIQRRFQRGRIDLGQDIAFMNLLALTEVDRDELAVDLGPDRDGVERLNRAERAVIDRHVAHGCRGDGDGHRRARGGLCGLGGRVTPENDNCRHGCERNPGDNEKNLPGIPPGHRRPQWPS